MQYDKGYNPRAPSLADYLTVSEMQDRSGILLVVQSLNIKIFSRRQNVFCRVT